MKIVAFIVSLIAGKVIIYVLSTLALVSTSEPIKRKVAQRQNSLILTRDMGKAPEIPTSLLMGVLTLVTFIGFLSFVATAKVFSLFGFQPDTILCLLAAGENLTRLSKALKQEESYVRQFGTYSVVCSTVGILIAGYFMIWQ